MNNLTIRTKLTLAFGVLGAFLLLVASLSIITLSDAKERFDSYVNGISARANTAHLLREAIDLRAISARNMVLVTKSEDFALEKRAEVRAQADVDANLSKLKAMAQLPGVTEKARQLIGDMAAVEQAYAPVATAIVDMALQGKKEDAIVKMNLECRPLLAKLQQASDAYASYTVERARQLVQLSAEEYATQRNYLMLACLLALVGAVVAGALITRGLTRALGGEPIALCEVVGRVADGDLSTPIQVPSGDLGSVMAAVARMQDSLIHVVSTVRSGSEGVSVASAEIASGNNDLSARTEQQASALEETASSMEQLSATVKQNADSARQANQLAQSASTVAVKGGNVVTQVVETMKGINDSSRKISDIISVIEGIAFQTNILALNAAVEAARAGEQGRGFAVVASEVRSLAGRSADAAKEIKGLISTSVERVEQGTVLVNQAGVTMSEVVSSIRRVTDIMGEISAASAEQAAGVGQVGEAVNQLDQSTQQNAALVEEMAAAASSLKVQAQGLVQAVGVFQLGSRGAVSEPLVGNSSAAPQRAQVRRKERANVGSARSSAPLAVKPAPRIADVKPKRVAVADADGDWASF